MFANLSNQTKLIIFIFLGLIILGVISFASSSLLQGQLHIYTSVLHAEPQHIAAPTLEKTFENIKQETPTLKRTAGTPSDFPILPSDSISFNALNLQPYDKKSDLCLTTAKRNISFSEDTNPALTSLAEDLAITKNSAGEFLLEGEIVEGKRFFKPQNSVSTEEIFKFSSLILDCANLNLQPKTAFSAAPTRAEYLALLFEINGHLSTEESEPCASKDPLSADLAVENPHCDALKFALQKKIIAPDARQQIYPDAPLNRADLIILTHNFLATLAP